jgi:hypothetical protein
VLLFGCRLPSAQPAEATPAVREPTHTPSGPADAPPEDSAAQDPQPANAAKPDLPSHCRDCELEGGRCVEWVMDGIEDRTVAYQMDCDDVCCPKPAE